MPPDQLPEAFNLVVATHVSLCDDCRARLAALRGRGRRADRRRRSGSAVRRAVSRRRWPGSPAGRRPHAAPRQAAARPVSRRRWRDYVGGDLCRGEMAPARHGRAAGDPADRQARRWRGCSTFPRSGGARPRPPRHGTDAGAARRLSRQTDRFGPGDLEIAAEDLEHTPVAEAGAGLHLPGRHRRAAAVQRADARAWRSRSSGFDQPTRPGPDPSRGSGSRPAEAAPR